MAADQSAATSSNMQTVSVIAVTDPEKKTRLAKTCAGQDFIANAPLLLCFVTDLARPPGSPPRLAPIFSRCR